MKASEHSGPSVLEGWKVFVGPKTRSQNWVKTAGRSRPLFSQFNGVDHCKSFGRLHLAVNL